MCSLSKELFFISQLSAYVYIFCSVLRISTYFCCCLTCDHFSLPTDMDISSGGSTPTSESVHNRTLDHSRHKHPSSNSSNNILLSSSRLSSLYSNNNSSNNNSATITTNSSSCDPRHHPSSHHHHNNNNSDGKLSNSHLEPLTVNVNSSSNIQGPPTPTHSESHDGIDIRKGTFAFAAIQFLFFLR